MTDYSYRALSAGREIVRGEIRAADEAEAVQRINALHLTPFELREASKKKTSKRGGLFRSKSVRKEDLMVATRELSVMLRAGLPILRALRILIESNQGKKIGEVFTAIHQEAKKGESLASALEKEKKVFSDFYINMVKTGEKSGRLADVLLDISKDLEESLLVTAEVRTALAYPAFLLAMSGFALLFMFVFVIPRFTAIIAKLDVQLPIYSRLLLAAGTWAKNHLLILLAGLGALAYGTAALARNPRIRKGADRLLLKIPVVKNLTLEIELSRFARALAVLLHGGVEILSSIRMSVESMGNSHLRKRFSDVTGRIKKGESFHQAVKDIELFPRIAVHMIQVGEETGTLAEILEEVSSFFLKRFRNTMKRFISLLEPLIVAFVGIVIGFIVISLLSAIMSLNDVRF
jgi:general secretion pathway protein F